jgi:hypothetical protein
MSEYRIDFTKMPRRDDPCCGCGHIGEPFDEDTEPDECDCHWPPQSWAEIDATLHIPAAGLACPHCVGKN